MTTFCCNRNSGIGFQEKISTILNFLVTTVKNLMPTELFWLLDQTISVVCSVMSGLRYANFYTKCVFISGCFNLFQFQSVVSKEIRLPIHSVVLDVILDYIYEDRATKVEKSEDVEWISNCLVSADLLLIPRLVSICESALVGLLAIKNVGKILEFATMYNAVQLKTSCMYFMSYNLPAVVELRYSFVMLRCKLLFSF